MHQSTNRLARAWVIRGMAIPMLAILAACGAETTDSPPTTPTGSDLPILPNGSESPSDRYEGPQLTHAEIEVLESSPEQHVLALAVEVPSGGYELEHSDTSRGEAGDVTVDCFLVGPGAGETVTMALETHRLRVPLVADDRSVAIRIAEATRDDAPDAERVYRLARKLTR